jgi:hypothetical protein
LPDFPSLPVTPQQFLIITARYGSSFQIRYFLPGSLSFEPLGTIVIMLPKQIAVNNKIALSSGNNCRIMCALGDPDVDGL